MRIAVEPAAHIMIGEPAAPADHQHGFNENLDDRAADIDEDPDRKCDKQQCPESIGLIGLKRVEHIAVDEGNPQRKADLRLVHQNQKHDHAYSRIALEHSARRQGPDLQRAAIIRLEIMIGNMHDRAHNAQMRNQPDKNAENRNRQRQAFGQRIFFRPARPETQTRGIMHKTKDDRLRAENGDEDFQKAGNRLRAKGRESANQSGATEQQPTIQHA